MIASGIVPVVRLTEICRQAARSRIVTNADGIQSRDDPRPVPAGRRQRLLLRASRYFVPAADPETRNPAEQARQNDPPPVHTECPAALTCTERPARADRSQGACQHAPSVPAQKRAPPKKDRPPREQKAGIRRLMVHGTEKCASQYRSGDFVLAALDLTADPITRTLAPRHTPTRGVTPATSTARRPRRG